MSKRSSDNFRDQRPLNGLSTRRALKFAIIFLRLRVYYGRVKKNSCTRLDIIAIEYQSKAFTVSSRSNWWWRHCRSLTLNYIACVLRLYIVMNYTATDTYGDCARETSNVCTLRAYARAWKFYEGAKRGWKVFSEWTRTNLTKSCVDERRRRRRQESRVGYALGGSFRRRYNFSCKLCVSLHNTWEAI